MKTPAPYLCLKISILKMLKYMLCVLAICFGLLLTFILNPQLSYAHTTSYENFIIYHSTELSLDILASIDLSRNSISQTRLYDSAQTHSLCLNEGKYPKVIKSILGDDVFTAFQDKIVVLGDPTNDPDRFNKRGRELRFSQFLSHAMLHNLQYNYHGLWSSNPIGNHEEWKWEGYVEYEVLGGMVTLAEAVSIYSKDSTDEFDWITISKDYGTIKRHVRYMALVKYCFETLGWSYDQLMSSKWKESDVIEHINTALHK